MPAINGVEPSRGSCPDTAARTHPTPGISFPRQGSSRQHVDQLFRERLRTITWRIRHWSRYDLTVIGRCEVAKQILASCLAYHIQFVAPSDNYCSCIAAYWRFVGKGLLPEQQLSHLKGSPSAAVASLPKAMGGIAQVDIRAHASALQAKVAARLLWPHRQPWKVYMRHAFERAYQVWEIVLVQAV